MHLQSTILATLLASASTATASSLFAKRDSWGPAFSLGPAKYSIVSTTTTIYPGKMPSDQTGYLFVWLGISNGTGDLIQSIIGSYPKGQSECSGSAADTTWCISSEVYGNDASGYPNQWVGSLTTADTNYTNGIVLNYTLTDKSTYTWVQTMTDAVTGTLLSTYSKSSGPMLGWGTAIECDDYNGVACTGTISEQYYVNSTIILEEADSTFSQTLGVSSGASNTDMVTTDGGKTWTIAKISIPAMESDSSASSVSASSTATSANVNIAASTTLATSASVAAVSTEAATTSAEAFSASAVSSFISSAIPTFVPSAGSSFAPSNSTVAFPTGASPSKHHGHAHHTYTHHGH